MRVVEKLFIPASEGRPPRPKRGYEQARTPFDRLCDRGAIGQQQRQRLEALLDRTNPRRLRQQTTS